MHVTKKYQGRQGTKYNKECLKSVA